MLSTVSVQAQDNYDLKFQHRQNSSASSLNIHVLSENLLRGTKIPTSIHDLAMEDYNYTANYKIMVYTDNCFKPNSSGKIYVTSDVSWVDGTPNKEKSATITLYEKGTNKKIKSVTGKTAKNSSGGYKTYIEMNATFSSLDKTKSYYFKFEKSNDTLEANLSGSICW